MIIGMESVQSQYCPMLISKESEHLTTRYYENDEHQTARVAQSKHVQLGTMPEASNNFATNQQKRNSSSLQIVLYFADFRDLEFHPTVLRSCE
jgi:hypothetical protein